MKIFLFALLPLCAMTAMGQDTKGGQVLMEVAVAKKQAQKPPVTQPKPAHQILGQKVEYGGYFGDLAKAENKRALFSLRAPVEPGKDSDNLWYYPGAGWVQGVVLFSIKY